MEVHNYLLLPLVELGGIIEDYNRHTELECKLRLFGSYVGEYRLTVACKDEAS